MNTRRGWVWAVAILLLSSGPWAGSSHGRPDDPPKSSADIADQLRPGGTSDSYSDIDWSAIPPWRQTSFFGVKAKGQLFVYVVDCSGSMGEGSRLARAKVELRRSILRLKFPQRFHVIFYNDRPLPMPGSIIKSADLDSKDLLMTWLRRVEPEGETDPRGAMNQALGLRPDAIFLLSDGEFPEGTENAIAKKNTRKIPIHCVDLSGGQAGTQLKKIAKDSRGQYVERP